MGDQPQSAQPRANQTFHYEGPNAPSGREVRLAWRAFFNILVIVFDLYLKAVLFK